MSRRQDMFEIWQAGVNAVLPEPLITSRICLETASQKTVIHTPDKSYDIPPHGRVIVVGMGKASARMAQALEKILSPLISENRLSGWVNVPEDQVVPLRAIHLHGARPAGVNEPTEAGVLGSRKIVELLQSLTPDDLAICLVSGGGSALLPLPVPEITLTEKQELTRFLSGAGADIQELNTVRKELSLLKGGGMRKLCRGKRLLSLILSDVLGDPLDVIASGATVPNRSTPQDALAVLKKFQADRQ
ncbi:MAG: glycerate-2-kinase family protein, partial [Thermoguttaceae bacterium]|nr:glycerate-2-kinase family protein [Thermoguttaceae bacterium]